ncbi:hypothetical protein [Candidatus Electronema sp. JC]|uniref:hypothetical protein n=1 Tax=Candidatus Electronema sp. JC TaxID=3401570 RepID=UPI003B43A0E8
MKEHLLILGPPSSGKLTVSLSISNINGFKIFDNSKTVDIASLLYDFNTPDYRRYRDSLRFQFYTELLMSNIDGLISTFCYSGPDNNNYLYSIDYFLRKGGYVTYFIYLIASKDSLASRVVNDSRKLKKTFHEIEPLKGWFKNNPFWNQVNIRNLISVNTDSVGVDEIATTILSQVKR